MAANSILLPQPAAADRPELGDDGSGFAAVDCGTIQLIDQGNNKRGQSRLILTAPAGELAAICAAFARRQQ